MSPKPDVSAERVPQILTAALTVFSRQGLAGARMDEIAGEAGLSKGTLYLYFDSRDAIIEGIMDSFLSRELDLAQALAAEPRTTVEKLQALTLIVAADVQKLQPYISLYLEFIALAPRLPRVQAAIRRYFTAFTSLIEDLIRSGVAAGEMKLVDPHDAALTIGAIFEGTILLWVYSPESIDLVAQIHKSLHVLLTGLIPQGEKNGP